MGLTDVRYRSALAEIGGVTTSKDLDCDGFDAMMGYFQWLGFDPAAPKGQKYGDRASMASWPQLELIRSLWREITRRAYDGEAELNKWLLRHSKVHSLRFVTKEQAPKIITALMAWKRRVA